MDAVAANIADVRSRIARACQQAGRPASSVRLIPVSKTVGIDVIRSAYAAGCHRFGENRAQEAWAKAQALADVSDLSWAMLGHLQTNKAALVATLAAEFQALDSLRLAAELDRRLLAQGRQMDVLIEVNSSGEASKFGLPPDDVPAFAAQLAPFECLRVRGLMTVALASSDQSQVSACFERMRDVQRRLRESVAGSWDELSMGMSNDFERAIAHGATVVRIGRAIFGERAFPVVTGGAAPIAEAQ